MRRPSLTRWITVAAASLALLSPAAAGARTGDPYLAGPDVCPGSATEVQATAEAQATMLCEINFARRGAGVPPVALQTDLNRSAAAKAVDILGCNDFSHYACGLPWLTHLRETGYLTGCWQAGENLAWGETAKGTPGETMEAWLDSPLHRQNILSRNFSEIGIAEARGSLSGFSDVAVWVTHFGSHCGAKAGQSSGADTDVVHAAELSAGAAVDKARRGLGGAQVAGSSNRSRRHGSAGHAQHAHS